MACFCWPSLTLNGFKWLQNNDDDGEDDDYEDYDNDDDKRNSLEH